MPPRTSKAIDRAWAEAFSSAIIKAREPQGDGWQTFPQVKKRFGMGYNRTHQTIAKLVKEGKLERFVGLKSNGTKYVREIWYRPKV